MTTTARTAPWDAPRIVPLVAANGTLVIDHEAGEILAEHTINPDKDYQPKKHQRPLLTEGPQ